MKNNKYKYQLRRGSKKDLCPQCKRKTFVPYIDPETNAAVDAGRFGRCDRENKCGYFLYPTYADRDWKPTLFAAKPRVDFPEAYMRFNRPFQMNNLYKYLCTKYEPASVDEAFLFYGLASYCYDPRVLIVPYRNRNGKLRAVQLMDYKEDGHRNKAAVHHWYHSSLMAEARRRGKSVPADLEAYQANDSKLDCFFGEDLIDAYPDARIYLVEAPKSAVVCFLEHGCPSISKRLFLATYSCSALNEYRLLALKGRRVTVLPDQDAVDKWGAFMQSQKICRYAPHDLDFEYLGDGSDIADWYLSDKRGKIQQTEAQAGSKYLARVVEPPKPFVPQIPRTMTIEEYLATYEQVPCWTKIESPFHDGCDGWQVGDRCTCVAGL